MKYFSQYTSNTCAGSGNQTYFTMNDGEKRVGRIFYKIFASGEYNYSFLFSNIMDSTFSDGTVSHKNLICESYTIINVKVSPCKGILPTEMNIAESDFDFKSITFEGRLSKEVMPGEFFYSDPVKLNFSEGDYLCIEITFSGKMIPYHEETLLPVFIQSGDKWEYSKEVPCPGMIGCDREVKRRIGFLGDSITQGIGTDINSYAHWNAKLSAMLGEDYSYWNMGIGYGRANDAASDGAWLYKAKHNDIVVVCYGVNDIIQGISEEQIENDLKTIVEKLHKAGAMVVLQTVPPFNYTGEQIKVWENVNAYIKEELSKEADMVFDAAKYLGESEEKPYNAKFGGHPNAEGCEIWAKALHTDMVEFLDKIK